MERIKKMFGAQDMTVGKPLVNLATFAVPLLIGNLAQTLYNTVDTIVVGKYVGKSALAAVGTAGPILNLLLLLFMGISTGAGILVSQYFGAQRQKDLTAAVGTCITLTAIASVFIMIIGPLITRPLMSLLGTPDDVYDMAVAYLNIICIGIIGGGYYNIISGVLRGMGDSRHPMIFIGLAAIINTVLDLLFIAVFSMGAFGAALATVIAQSVSFLLCMLYLYKNKEQFGFDFRLKSFRMSKRILPTVIRLGVPIALQSSAGSISALFVSSFINTYGVAASAITGIGSKLNSIALIVCNALNTSGAAIIGQNFGAGMLERVRQTFRRVFVFDLIFVSLLSIGILSFPEAVFGLFNKSPDVLALAPVYAKVAAVSFMGFAFRSPSLALVNGLGQSKMNFLMGVVEGFVLRIGLTYLLGVVLKLGLPGFWYGSVIASYGYGLVMFPYYFSGVWEKEKTVVVS